MKQPRKRTAASASSSNAPTERERSVRKNVEPAADGQFSRQEEPAPPNHDEIRARAYQIYLERGRTPGAALDDWLQAEREHREGGTADMTRASASPPSSR